MSRPVPGMFRLLIGAAVVLTAAGACSKKKKPTDAAPDLKEVAGLSAIPAEADVVIGFDVRALASAPLVTAMVDQMLVRDPELRERFEGFAEACSISVSEDLGAVVLGIGADPRDAVMAVTGSLEEARIAACVRTFMGEQGGRLTVSQLEGRTVYEARRPDERTVFFTFGAKDTLILARSRELLAAAVGGGPRARDRAELAALIGEAGPSRAVWAAGLVGEQIGSQLVTLTRGAVSERPAGFWARLDPTDGLAVAIGARMDSEDDAKALVSYAKPQIEVASLAAQAKGLGRLVSKVTVEAKGASVVLSLALTGPEVDQVLSRIDTTGQPPQNAAPAPAQGED